MLLEPIIFYLFATLFVVSAIVVVTQRSTIHSALFLVLAFFSAAVIWLFLEAEFLALILILVYVGAVMTLFLFVVMMLDIKESKRVEGYVGYLPFGLIIVALLVGAMLYVIGPHHFGLTHAAIPAPEPANYSNVKGLGMVLYTYYVYPFELAAVLLLVAMVSAITLSLRKSRSKKQSISKQVQTDPQDRLRMAKIASHKEPKP